MKDMPTSFQTVIDHFKNKGWPFQVDCRRPLLHAGFKGKTGNFHCVVAVDLSDDFVKVISFVPVVVPPQKRATAAEICARLSFPMKVGNFELDCDDGVLSFRTYSVYPKGELKEEVIQRVVAVNLAMIDVHFPAFIRLVYGSVIEAASQLKDKASPPEQKPQTAGRISFN